MLKKLLNVEDYIFVMEVERLKNEKSKLELKRFKVSLNWIYFEGCLDEYYDGCNEWFWKIRLFIEKGDVIVGDDLFFDYWFENLVRFLIFVECFVLLFLIKYNLF